MPFPCFSLFSSCFSICWASSWRPASAASSGAASNGAIHRLPLVRSVYSAVKQVTDFFFSEQPMKFTRVVAVEYPRAGMWSIAFVTSEGFQAIRAAANEPLVGVFIPTSPMPMTGYALTVRKSEVVDLHMTIDEAIQFIVSCGLVIPAGDLKRLEASAHDRPSVCARHCPAVPPTQMALSLLDKPAVATTDVIQPRTA